MRAFADYNPIVLTVYFLCVAGIAMFSMHPVLIAGSLFGALLLFLVRNGRKHGRSHLCFLGLFLVTALLNPLVSHNGATVLFVMNHNPVTLEALLYGIAASGSILAVLYWLRSFSQIMTRDKLLYVCGAFSPQLSLILSMAMRYVALFSQQIRKVSQTQKALGLYGEDTLFDRIHGGLRVCSVMLTWALENGIITADSMAARGYGCGRRSQFAVFRFRCADLVLLVLSLALLAVTGTALGCGALEFSFYPHISPLSASPLAIAGYAAHGLLVLLPVIIEAKEAIQWRSYLSNI